jgi:Parvulin-like peptidyl-prolyl isomerase
VFAVLAVTLVLSACGHGGGTGAQPAATVAGTKITNEQVAKEAQMFTFLAGLNRSQCGTIAAGETQQQACNRFALGNLIQGVFVKNYAAEHQIAVTDQQVNTVLANLDKGVGTAKVDQALASNHLTRDDLTTLANQVLLFQQVEQDLASAKSDDATLRQLYQQQLLSFTTINAEHILVKTEAEARKIYQEVTKPGATEADFQALAKQDSIDTTSGKKGGALGATPASRLVKPFAVAAVALKPGEISKPVHTQFGWHVIRLIDKQVTPFAQAKTQLLQSQAPAVFNAWLVQQATDQKVDVNPSFGQYDTKTLTVVPITSTNPSDTATPTATSAATATP